MSAKGKKCGRHLKEPHAGVDGNSGSVLEDFRHPGHRHHQGEGLGDLDHRCSQEVCQKTSSTSFLTPNSLPESPPTMRRPAMKRMYALGLKCGRPFVLLRPAPTTARLHPSRHQRRPRPLSLPDEIDLKVNLDGAWNLEDNSAGIEVIARESEGNLVSGAASSISAQSSIEVEAKAALEALSLAQIGNFSRVIFESDSQVLVNNPSKASHWLLRPVGARIKHASNFFSFSCWNWIPRKANEATLARPESWISRPPSLLVHVLSRNGLPCPPM
ncbi:hypothetical protein ACLB2K_072761 [Fragaria x ananassa]